MTTLKEIADICNVSMTTVSNILHGKSKASEETRQRVLKVVEELGYKPNYQAQGLRMQKTNTIAIIAEDIAQFTSPPIIESIMEYCEQNGYRVYVKNLRLYARWSDTWYDRDKAYHSVLDPVLQEVLALRVDGVIYIAGHARIIRCFDEKFPVPAMMVYAFSDSVKVPSVVIDDVTSAYEIINYTLEKGHKKIGVIGGRIDNIHTQQRLLGYQKALFDKGIPYNPDYVFYARWDRESGYEAAKELLKQDISAIFCLSDRMAGGVYDYLDEIGKTVGKDISVVGFDDQEMAVYFKPKLTTTALPLAQIGKESAKLLVERLENPQKQTEHEDKQIVRIPCTMVERNSVGEI